ncbi:hypothetical protein SDC9_97353 [bioreactor metagenome]|uniref:Uncharacterized protein n=1 Tax=bioreactor metagenome TaxID=1076179 RepID=A0A645AE94_9ZZZZ
MVNGISRVGGKQRTTGVPSHKVEAAAGRCRQRHAAAGEINTFFGDSCVGFCDTDAVVIHRGDRPCTAEYKSGVNAVSPDIIRYAGVEVCKCGKLTRLCVCAAGGQGNDLPGV